MLKARDVKELINLVQNELESVKVCFGCEVVSVNQDRVSVRLSVRDTLAFSFPDILDIPVFVLKAGKGIIYMPASIGDKGLIICSTKSTDQFKKGSVTSYKNFFDIDNSFYFGGFFSNADSKDDLVDNLRIKYGSDIIDIKDGEIQVTSTKVIINESQFLPSGIAIIPQLKVGTIAGLTGGAVETEQDIVSGGVSVQTHTHGGVYSGTKNTTIPN